MLRRALVFCASTTSQRPFVGPSPDFGPGFAIHSRNEKSEFQSKDAIFVARMGLWHGFDDITRFLRDTKYPFQPQLIWQAKPPKSNQTKRQCYRGAVRGCVSAHHPNGCIVTVPPGSSRDLTAGDAHPGVPCRSSHCSPAPGWTGARRGGSLSTRASRVSPARLSSAELLSPWFPTLLLPPTTPWPYYASYRGRVTNDLRYFRILKCDISPRVRKFFSKKC